MELIWTDTWCTSSGAPFFSYSNQDSLHWLRYHGFADFRISIDMKEISCYPVPGISDAIIRHLLLDQVLPRCLAYEGEIILHASAVHIQRGLILFLGESGAGKSTLAAHFHQAGQMAISDDCTWVKCGKTSVTARPVYKGLRLWQDSLNALFPSQSKTKSTTLFSSKRRIILEGKELHGDSRGINVLAVFLLSPLTHSPASEIVVKPLSNRDAFISLAKQSFRLNSEFAMFERQMKDLGHIVTRLPFYQLYNIHDYALLPFVRQKILQTIRASST